MAGHARRRADRRAGRAQPRPRERPPADPAATDDEHERDERHRRPHGRRRDEQHADAETTCTATARPCAPRPRQRSPLTEPAIERPDSRRAASGSGERAVVVLVGRHRGYPAAGARPSLAATGRRQRHAQADGGQGRRGRSGPPAPGPSTGPQGRSRTRAGLQTRNQHGEERDGGDHGTAPTGRAYGSTRGRVSTVTGARRSNACARRRSR